MTELQRIRISKRMTRRQLATAADVSYATIYQVETGRRALGDEVLFKLADALAVDPIDLRPKAAAA